MGKSRINLCCFAIMGILVCGGGVYAQTASMTLTSPGINIMDGVYVDPYYATVDGVPNTLVICDDYADDTYQNESWTANVYGISNVAQTMNTINWDLTAAQQAQKYNEAAYLTTELLAAFQSNNTIAAGELSFAVWGVFDPTAIPSLTAWSSKYGSAAQSYLSAAEAQTYTPGEFSNVLVYSPNTSDPITCPTGDTCGPTAPPQEFLVVRTPEPPVPFVWMFDLLALGAVAFLWRRYLVRPATH